MSFSADISRFVKRAKGNMDTAVRMVTIKLADRVIDISPVREGRFRANWQFGEGQMDRTTTDGTDPGGAASRARLRAAAAGAKAGTVIYLSNSLPYAIDLENGSSSQAPLGIVHLAAQEFSRYVAEAAREARSGR